MKYALAIVFVVRYFAADGTLYGVAMNYGYPTYAECAVRKEESDKEDEAITGVTIDSRCVDESEVPALLAPGQRT